MARMMMAATLAGLMMVAGYSVAKDSKDACLQAGDSIGPFYVTKVAGPEDGVANGKTLCYRCKYGSSPMVMVFARETGGKMDQLVKGLDSAVAQHQDAKLRSFVTLIGGDVSKLTQTAEKMAANLGVKNLPVVVAEDAENGPSNYKLDPKAEVTIVVAKNGKVSAQHTFAAADIDIEAVMKEVKTLIN
ncbi:hypothetical protein SH139x_003146 [Planctomycetaceae bacterium SH139]